MLRFSFVVVCVVLDFVLSLPLLAVAVIVGLFSRTAMASIGNLWVKKSFLLVTKLCGVKTTYKGLENIPKEEGCLYVANHLGFFDVICVYPYLPGYCGMISKKEFSIVPVFAQWMKIIYCIFLDRKDIKDGLKKILRAIELVKDGVSIYIFPEGTRSKDGQVHTFKEGSFKIAKKSGCKIVPIAITGTDEIFEKHFPRIIPGEVKIEFGEPIDTKLLSKDDRKFLGRKCANLIRTMRGEEVIEDEAIQEDM